MSAALCSVVAVIGCAQVPGGGEDGLVPDREVFPPVADAMELRCATLDCHGAEGRNLRLYSGSGLRLSASDVPGYGSTSEAEYEASYLSIVALEPAVLGAVLSDGGARPERLTLVRKARGTEKHAGGAVIEEGDDADRCLVSWLSPTLDEEACSRAADFGPPPGWPDNAPP